MTPGHPHRGRPRKETRATRLGQGLSVLLVAVLMLQSLPLSYVLAPHEHAPHTERMHKCGCTEGFCRCKHDHSHSADHAPATDGVRLVCADHSQAVFIALPFLKAVAVQHRMAQDVPARIRHAGYIPSTAPSPFPNDIFHPPRSQQIHS